MMAHAVAYFAARMSMISTIGRTGDGPGTPHVLFLPKWWPNQEDPQLGDFLRKQALAVATVTRASVLDIRAVKGQLVQQSITVTTEGGLWETHSHFYASTHPFKPWRKLVNLTRYWNAAMAGWELVVRERGMPDLLHVHILVRPALVALRIRKKYGIPYILSEQSSEYLDGTYAGKGALFKALNRYLFRKAAAVSAVSAWLGDGLVQLGLCTQYAVVPNVVPGLDRPLPQSGPPGHFLVVADLVDRTKNVSGVIRALAVAREKMPTLQLTIIGDGPDRKALETLANDKGLGQVVKFLGRLPNSGVLDHMAGAGAVIINSNVETFSVVTGEALAQGKPVIATRCGGPVAFITPENGILIEPKDDEALAQAMLQLASEAQRYSPDRIRDSVSARFSPMAVGSAFLDLYHRTLAQHHGR